VLAGDTYHGDSEGKCVPDRECARDLDRQFHEFGDQIFTRQDSVSLRILSM